MQQGQYSCFQFLSGWLVCSLFKTLLLLYLLYPCCHGNSLYMFLLNLVSFFFPEHAFKVSSKAFMYIKSKICRTMVLCEKTEMHCSTGLLVLKLFLTSSFFLRLISSAYSLTHTEHHHAGRSCYHRRTAARNRHHGAARICLHSSSTEGGACWSYCDPCHSDTCHSCKRELLTMIDEQQKTPFSLHPILFFFMHYVNI